MRLRTSIMIVPDDYGGGLEYQISRLQAAPGKTVFFHVYDTLTLASKRRLNRFLAHCEIVGTGDQAYYLGQKSPNSS